jgi:hypothetical protein
MDEVHKSRDSWYYTPTSEPFKNERLIRIHFFGFLLHDFILWTHYVYKQKGSKYFEQ